MTPKISADTARETFRRIMDQTQYGMIPSYCHKVKNSFRYFKATEKELLLKEISSQIEELKQHAYITTFVTGPMLEIRTFLHNLQSYSGVINSQEMLTIQFKTMKLNPHDTNSLNRYCSTYRSAIRHLSDYNCYHILCEHIRDIEDGLSTQKLPQTFQEIGERLKELRLENFKFTPSYIKSGEKQLPPGEVPDQASTANAQRDLSQGQVPRLSLEMCRGLFLTITNDPATAIVTYYKERIIPTLEHYRIDFVTLLPLKKELKRQCSELKNLCYGEKPVEKAYLLRPLYETIALKALTSISHIEMLKILFKTIKSNPEDKDAMQRYINFTSELCARDNQFVIGHVQNHLKELNELELNTFKQILKEYIKTEQQTEKTHAYMLKQLVVPF